MSVDFLSNFMHFARSITEAERCIAADHDLNVAAYHLPEENASRLQAFQDLALENVRRAIREKAVIISNNVVTDPSLAPTTNTSFDNLRVCVAFPVDELGAVYLDQPIRQGVFQRGVIDRLMHFAQHLVNTGADLTEEEIAAKYQEYNA